MVRLGVGYGGMMVLVRYGGLHGSGMVWYDMVRGEVWYGMVVVWYGIWYGSGEGQCSAPGLREPAAAPATLPHTFSPTLPQTSLTLFC